MKGFWREFWSADHSVVNTMTVLAVMLASPIVLLASACVIYHVFILHKGIDGPVGSLLTYMIGAATGGVIGQGVSMFSRTTMSQITSIGSNITPIKPPAAPPPRMD